MGRAEVRCPWSEFPCAQKELIPKQQASSFLALVLQDADSPGEASLTPLSVFGPVQRGRGGVLPEGGGRHGNQCQGSG